MSEDCPGILRNPMQHKSWAPHHHVACGLPTTPGQSSLILFSFGGCNSITGYSSQRRMGLNYGESRMKGETSLTEFLQGLNVTMTL